MYRAKVVTVMDRTRRETETYTQHTAYAKAPCVLFVLSNFVDTRLAIKRILPTPREVLYITEPHSTIASRMYSRQLVTYILYTRGVVYEQQQKQRWRQCLVR